MRTPRLFYGRVIDALIAAGTLRECDHVLILYGGDLDRRQFADRGFRNVTVSNLEPEGVDLIVDAEAVRLPDAAIDVAVVHAGLHHCRSPHHALTEMIRIARKAVIVIEARDSFAMRLAEKIGLTPRYELEAVAIDGGSGGLRNGPIPNFIYRWTEHEVRKTVESARPDKVNDIRFFYGLRLPHQRLTISGRTKQSVAAILCMACRVLARIAPKQGNEFAFVITTAADKPWITRAPAVALSSDYRLGFDTKRYRRAA